MTKNETLVWRGKKWFRYDAPHKRLFKQLQKTLTGAGLSQLFFRLQLPLKIASTVTPITARAGLVRLPSYL